RQRHLPGDQPLLVDRQPPPSLPVRNRGRVGRTSTNATDDESLARCAREAEAAAEAMAGSAGADGYPGFPSGGPVPTCDTFDEATAGLDATRGGAALAEVFAVAER